MTFFSHAIVKTPGKSLINGLTSAHLGKPNYEKALHQHQKYNEALKECGVTVHVLPADETFPDSTFVEDTALLTSKCAIISRPGVPSRRDEIISMIPEIEKYYKQIEEIIFPGTLEPGDIMMVENHFYIGLSKRTNLAGANQLIKILSNYGLSASIVTLENVLHLKTGIAYLENNTVLVSGEFIQKIEFQSFNRIEVPETEAYAANSIWVNGTVIIPEGFPITKSKIDAAGYKIIEVNVSEFQKLDGGVSCLSLRF